MGALTEIKQLFNEVDIDGSGAINEAEMKECLQDPKIDAFFHMLEIDVNDVNDIHRLFTLLDDDGSDEVSIDEFVEGVGRLRGIAKSIDVYEVLARLDHI